ncbi:MAG: hypothetical protein QNJ12_09075 [Ilumatobacter sp.]|uniref:TOPRIM nucleotidyl transferase/hydrolase domain-containing protein n=1 Tax=Ilumatobacter sp. TaxID=1967498 RepID=UPI0026111EA2|nr:TOPRIM nucleotidyl transferase/hydrolase domain-containing protein [Ilumatobacter sp.]MDJ0768934.1 hypothetical protein [Ilumatobacter sp.]
MNVPDLDPGIRTAVLVEGVSDRAAVEALARRVGRDLAGVAVVAMGGATNVGHHVRRYAGSVAVIGLCDEAEVAYFDRALGDGAYFVCHRDLEDELLRAVGVDATLGVLEAHDELRTFRVMQQQPAQRGRPVDEQLHRFLGIRSGRKERLAAALAALLDPADLPPPLGRLLDRI